MIIFSAILLIGGFLGLTHMKSEINETKERSQLDKLFIAAANKYGISNWLWLKAIAKQESDLGLNERVRNGLVSYDGKSWGLMQIAPNIGSQKEIEIKGDFTSRLLFDDAYSIDIAARLIKYYQDKYNGDIRRIFRAYNQGEKNEDAGKDFTVKYTKGGYDNAVIKHLVKFEAEEFQS